jgi:hypothetical protein
MALIRPRIDITTRSSNMVKPAAFVIVNARYDALGLERASFSLSEVIVWTLTIGAEKIGNLLISNKRLTL